MLRHILPTFLAALLLAQACGHTQAAAVQSDSLHPKHIARRQHRPRMDAKIKALQVDGRRSRPKKAKRQGPSALPTTTTTLAGTTTSTLPTSAVTTSPPSPSPPPPPPRPTPVALYGQCGGTSYTGSTVCQEGGVCTYSSPSYSQCLPPDSCPGREMGTTCERFPA